MHAATFKGADALASRGAVGGAPVKGSVRLAPLIGRRATVSVQAVAETEEEMSGRAFRRSLNKTGRYVRNTTNRPESIDRMEEHGVGYSKRGLVAQMRSGDNSWQQGQVTVKLAEAYGFCWGVERAVQMAYEAKDAYPGKKLHVTNEIIHNPEVNARLEEMEFGFVPGELEEDGSTSKDFSQVETGDVVLLPAFGASLEEMKMLNDKEVQIVDTTCPWVSKVWNAVDAQTRKAHTSIIHGKWAHEETVATASFATDYVVVKNLEEAEFVANFILEGGEPQAFLDYFHPKAMSKGFDPATMLERVGLANQTTMLKGETQAIGKLLESTMMKKYGPAEVNEHYMVVDTICDATQVRQDAMYDLTSDPKNVDMMIVVGGFNSSNTSHLQEIAEHKGFPSFWVDSAERIDVAGNKLDHKMSWGELVSTENWLDTSKPLTVGVTSGASTPDKAIEDVLDKVFTIFDSSYSGITPKECPPPAVQH